ncbi:hypothetical protein P9112_000794 [Eukaryota sp. TZLM1-RC]
MRSLVAHNTIRDLSLALFLLVVFWFTLSKRVDVSARLEFIIPNTHKTTLTSKYSLDLPSPIISKLDGKQNYLVKLSGEPKLTVYDLTSKSATLPRRTQKPSRPKPISSVPLPTSSFPVALVSGALTNSQHDVDLGHEPLEGEVIIVVTEDFGVFCFDQHLNLLWDSHLYHDVQDALHDLATFEIAVTVVPQRIVVGDEGCVVVAVRPRKVTHRDTDSDLSPFDDELISHVDYFAFAGRTGEERWCHVASDDVSRESGITDLWEIDERMSASSFGHSHHHTENDWRVFRSSVLNSLPFSWSGPLDSKIDSEFFITDDKLTEEIAKGSFGDAHEQLARDSYSPFLTIQQQRNVFSVKLLHYQLKKDKVFDNVIIGSFGNGIEVVHLYTGKVLAHLTLLSDKSSYADVNDDGLIERVEVQEVSNDHDDNFQPCRVVVTSLSSKHEVLWESSICHLHEDVVERVVGSATENIAGSGSGRRVKKRGQKEKVSRDAQVMLDATSPLIDKEEKLIVFSTSDGLLTAYTTEGFLSWQSHNGAEWNPSDVSFAPSLKKVSINQKVDCYLSFSDHSVRMVTSKGEFLVDIPITDHLSSQVTVGDVSNRGISSVIVPCNKFIKVYSLKIHHQANAMARAVLITILVSVVIVVGGVQVSLRKRTLHDLVGDKEEEIEEVEEVEDFEL